MTTKELLEALKQKALNGEISEPSEIYELYRMAARSKTLKMKNQIGVGDTVTFRSRGRTYEGEITKVNRKTAMIRVTIQDNEPMNWASTWKCSIVSLSPKKNAIQKIKEKLS